MVYALGQREESDQCRRCGSFRQNPGSCDCGAAACDLCGELVNGRLACPDCAPKLEGPFCPNCGQEATFTEHETQCTETHGLDCPPYETWTERWLVCSVCHAHTDAKELEKANARD